MAKPANNKTPAQIEADIRRTRAEIAQEVDVISDKVSPENLADNAKSALSSAQEALVSTVHDAGSSLTGSTQSWTNSLVEVVKRNPLPATLIGLGVGLLAAGGASAGRSGSADTSGVGTSNRGTSNRGTSGTGNTRSHSGLTVPTSRGYGAGHYGPDTARGVDIDYTPDDPQLPQSASSDDGLWDSTKAKASNLADSAGEQARQAKSGLAGFIDDHPLLAGGAAALLALAVGLSVPTTRQEDELMGEQSDHLLGQAKAKLQDGVEVAKTTAKETLGTVKGEVKDKVGGTTQEVKAKAKSAVVDAKNGVTDKLDDAKVAVKDVAKAAKKTAKKTAKKEAAKRDLTASSSKATKAPKTTGTKSAKASSSKTKKSATGTRSTRTS